MKKPGALLACFATVMVLTLFGIFAGNRAVTVISDSLSTKSRTCIIIDPGHGGEDGGATSCSGKLESAINLEISLRLEDMLHLLGRDTRMIRKTDISIYTKGETIAQKKISDLKERVRIINEKGNAIFVSIHQNYFPMAQYSGAQVFYSENPESKVLAAMLQKELVAALNSGSNRKEKAGKGIYLLEKTQPCGVLIECGFLSNPQEESRLRQPEYQKKLAAVIAATLSAYLS